EDSREEGEGYCGTVWEGAVAEYLDVLPERNAAGRAGSAGPEEPRGVSEMCGIAGIIHRTGPSDIGSEMTRMLQSMKHRGPDSSGFALYGPPTDLLVMRVKLADPNEKRDIGWAERLERHRDEGEHRLAKIRALGHPLPPHPHHPDPATFPPTR